MTDKNTMPSQFSIFKGKSALRMQLQKPEAIEDKFKIGCIILQMAPFKEERSGVRIFAWEEQKVTVKLGVNDLTQFIYAIDAGGEAKLFHQYNETTKSIEFKLNGDKGWFLSVAQSAKDGAKQNISIPISREEGYALGIMLRAALPLIHNWF